MLTEWVGNQIQVSCTRSFVRNEAVIASTSVNGKFEEIGQSKFKVNGDLEYPSCLR